MRPPGKSQEKRGRQRKEARPRRKANRHRIPHGAAAGRIGDFCRAPARQRAAAAARDRRPKPEQQAADRLQTRQRQPAGKHGPEDGRPGEKVRPAPDGRRQTNEITAHEFFTYRKSTRIDSLKLCETEHLLHWGNSRRLKIRPYYPSGECAPAHRWKIAIVGAPTPDNLADSSNESKESYAVFL